jgi:DNA repair photolyase
MTRQCLQVLKDAGFSPIVLTRESLVLEDAALLAATPGALVGVSLCTDDDAVAKAFEPRAEPSSKRIDTLRQLKQAGVGTFAMITPMLPMNPERLVALLAPHIDVVHLGPLFERERIAATLRAAGVPGPLDAGWEADTAARLQAGFEAQGVRVNPTEAPWCYLH